MKIEITLPELDALLQKMGARYREWRPERSLPDFEEISIRLEQGIDVSLDEVDWTNGLLSYKGQQVLLYIRDNTRRDGVLQNPEAGNRYHVAYCRTLDEMRQRKKYERYVSTTRRDGLFTIDYMAQNGRPASTESGLCVCKNCLGLLAYKEFRQGQPAGVWINFDLEEFFGLYSTFFPSRPTRTDVTSTLSHYVPDWSRISTMVRSARGWTCEDCRVCLSDPPMRKWLHVHHESGVKTDNLMSNLKVLCIECHAKQWGHQTMKVPEEARRALARLRSGAL